MSEDTTTVEPAADATQIGDSLNGDGPNGASPSEADAAATPPALDAVTESQVEPAAAGEPATEQAPAEPPEPAAAGAPEPPANTTETTEEATDAPDAPEEQSPSAGPRTVGRYIADALRAAGVR